MAISRTEALKRRLKKNNNLQIKDTEQTELLFLKNTLKQFLKTKSCQPDPSSAPHYLVINPKKLDKVRSAYDCTAEVECRF